MRLCPSGKISYSSEGAASAMLRQIVHRARRQRQLNPTLPKRAYQCDRCARWHLTSRA